MNVICYNVFFYKMYFTLTTDMYSALTFLFVMFQIARCDACQRYEKLKTVAPKLTPINIVEPMHIVGMDLIGRYFSDDIFFNVMYTNIPMVDLLKHGYTSSCIY